MNEPDNSCLNCGHPIEGNYCNHCGQPADTGRFTIQQVVKNDLFKRILYFDKGLFFTLGQLTTKPGVSIREYINGKRANHYNYLSLLAISILTYSLIEHFAWFHYADLADSEKEILTSFEVAISNYPKIVFLSLVPLYGLLSFVFFRRAKHNYAEHLVLNCFRSSVIIFVNASFLLISSFLSDLSSIKRLNSILMWIVLFYGSWFYFQCFTPYYKNKFLLFGRSFLCSIIPALVLIIGIVVYIEIKAE